MPAQLLTISEREEDLRFGEFVAFANNLPFEQAANPKEVKDLLVQNPQTVVFWAADDEKNREQIARVLVKSVPPLKVFAITEKALNKYPSLFKLPVFGHHLLRRYQNPAPIIFSKLVGASLLPYPFDLLRYFPEKTQNQKIKMTRSGHKKAAVDAIQAYLKKQNVPSRLASVVARSTDELILNALFDAPVGGDGKPLRANVSRGSDFELSEREQVQIELAATSEYIGISVTDLFGSLKRNAVFNFLWKDYQDKAYIPKKNDPNAGLGLHGIITAGISILFVCKPGLKTEVMLFFPKADSYKDFRNAPRFVSIIAD